LSTIFSIVKVLKFLLILAIKPTWQVWDPLDIKLLLSVLPWYAESLLEIDLKILLS
jgi:hypothetical protein